MLAFVTTRPNTILPVAMSAVVAVAAPALSAQDRDQSNPDSVALLRDAKEAQARFERFREERIPPELAGFGRGCDDLIGRFCLRFEDGEDESEWTVPEEPVEFGMARVRVSMSSARSINRFPGIPGFWASASCTWEKWGIGRERRI